MRGNRGDRWRLWVVSELYYPEDTSTGAILTELAEGLAGDLDVRVLCGQPTYLRRGHRAPHVERRGGVDIRRCRSTTLDKNVVPFRLINMITLSLSILAELLLRLRRGDRVLVVTNPPILPFAVAFACLLRRARLAVLVHDVYPEALVVTGAVAATSRTARAIDRAYGLLYSRATRVVVLGRDMRALLVSKYPHLEGRVKIITNWANLEFVEPLPRADSTLLQRWGIGDKFVVQYAGNIGRTHGIEELLEAAARTDEGDTHYVFVGEGAKLGWLKKEVADRTLNNVTVLPRIPKSERAQLNALLSACDVAIIAFIPGMAGVSVPSRMYNILAAGVPIIAVTDAHSELAIVVEEESVGWVVPPGDPEAVALAVREASKDADRREDMAARARGAATEHYGFSTVCQQFRHLLAVDMDTGD